MLRRSPGPRDPRRPQKPFVLLRIEDRGAVEARGRLRRDCAMMQPVRARSSHIRVMNIDDLRREEIDDARRMTPQQKLEAGGELFDYACLATKAGIRMQHPHASETEILQLLRERVELGERLERERILKRDRPGRD